MLFLIVAGDVGIIDGDSLLYLLFTHGFTLLDWSFGGQFLHLVELVERFLLHFIRRNVKIQVVFFDEGEWIWRNDAGKLLARRILIAHLQQRVQNPLLDVVQWRQRWSSDQWRESFAFLDPNWIVCFDSAAATDPESKRYFEGVSHHHHAGLSCNVVLLPDVQFKGNDVDAWVRTRSNKEASNYTVPSSFEWDDFCKTQNTTPAAVDGATAVKNALSKTKGDAAVIKAIAECFDAQKKMPLANRSVKLLDTDRRDNILTTLKSFYSELLPHAGADLIDVVDGRLLHHVVVHGADLNKLSIAVAKQPTTTTTTTTTTTASSSNNNNNNEVAAPAAAVVAEVAPQEVAAPVADSWDAVDSWADFDVSKIQIPDAAVAVVETPAPVAAPVAVVAAPVSAGQSVEVPPGARFGHNLVFEEPKKKVEKKSKREMKGEQRAAHLEKLQADSLLGRYVQKHVITLDRKQVKESGKAQKAKELAAANERTKQEQNWKDWLQKNDISDTSKAMSFVADNEFAQDLEFNIMLDIMDAAKTADDAMPILSELVFRNCPSKERLAALADKWDFKQLSSQLLGTSTTPDPKWLRRQLVETGESLPREQGDVDPRVKHFRPDPWQKQLLDHVDNNKSVVVVAPTSAGKTFIQYYVMEKVLREDDAGVVVYVCPTKPLCAQVLAGVNARFDKSYPSGSANVLCGLFLRDRRQRAESCQILITVPECLDMLLLSPTKTGQNWAKKIKWILFDEVHTINDPMEGPVWERILQLTTCPFLALSATVGQPEAFRSWLSETRRERVELIVHSERYNDLRMFVASTANSTESKCSMLPLHPCTFVSTEQLAKEGAFPSLADFESKDSFSLWQAMVEEDRNCASDLAPETFFLDPVISRQQSKKWAAALKARMIELAKTKPAICTKILRVFNDSLKVDQVLLTDDNKEEQPLFDLTQELLKDGPVLLFCHHRLFTERMVEFYANKLHKMQQESGPSARKVKEAERLREMAERKKKQTQKRTKNRKEQEEMERAGELEVESVLPIEEQFPAEFTLRRKGHRGLLGRDDREELIKQVIFKTKWGSDHPLIHGLRRGIGCHHEGLPHRYRVAVELMFRTGDITVVFSTQTLAQGIHAPARSVVLVHDTPTFLTPTSLRQMTGRAGRRGYDLLGQVVFYGVRYSRIRQLLSSRVPQLRGGFPISASLTLRMIMLQHSGASSRDLIEEQINQLLNQPFLSLDGRKPTFDGLLHHYQSFNAKLLTRLGLLSPSPEHRSLWLAPLAAHLSFTDPFNLFLIYILGENLLNKICDVEDPKLETTQHQIIPALACALEPLHVHPSMVEAFKNVEASAYRCGVVGKVPADVLERMKQYNKLVISLFLESAKEITREQPCTLPLSGTVIGSEPSAATNGALSVFALTSGASDNDLSSLERMVNAVRADLLVEHTSLPCVPELTHYNSFVVDFFNMLIPNADTIIKSNHLPRAWFKLAEFSTSLRVLSIALSKVVAEYDHVMDSNLYRMLTDEAEAIVFPTVEKKDQPEVRQSKRVSTAIIHLSAEFAKKFEKTKH